MQPSESPASLAMSRGRTLTTRGARQAHDAGLEFDARTSPLRPPPLSSHVRESRILVVDTAPLNGAFLRDTLLREGREVRVSHDATEALALVAAFKPSLMVISLWLPGINGLQLAERLKANPSTREIVLIALCPFVMTPFNFSVAERIAGEAGFVACLPKPADGRWLSTLVGAYLASAPGLTRSP